MRPAVVTAVLILVCVQDTVTGNFHMFLYPQCEKQPAEPCGDGWSRIDDNRCVKLIKTQKTFNDAEEHCRSLNGHLVSVHDEDQFLNLMCSTWNLNSELTFFWIGAQRSGAEFRNTDGSEFDYSLWFPGQPDNTHEQEVCVDSSLYTWGLWRDVPCSQKKLFVCAKKM